MRDLSDELRELLTERAHAVPPPPAPGDTIVRRVRRRAAVRAGAAAGGVTLATVAIVAVGAAAVRTDPPGGDGVAGSGVCEPVTHHLPTSGEDAAKHVAGRIDYPRTPPNSGPHASSPALPSAPRSGAGAPTVEQLVHNLEHGYVVVWYEPAAADDAALDAALEGAPRKVLAAPWSRGPLPAPYVMTAWGHEQRCTVLSRQVVESFYEQYGHTNGDAPEGAAF